MRPALLLAVLTAAPVLTLLLAHRSPRSLHAAQPLRERAKPCREDCSGVGVCDPHTGLCRCRAGWKGPACEEKQLRPCTNGYRLTGVEPRGPPLNWTEHLPYGPWNAPSVCLGVCDTDIAACFCNGTQGRVPAPPGSPPGAPPLRRGRPLGLHCQPKREDGGAELYFGEVEPALLFGEAGWCEAARPQHRCSCHWDGYAGEFCDQVTETFCPGLCGGHGECLSGFCMCHSGWYGQDCTLRLSGGVGPSQPAPAHRKPERKRPRIYVYDLPPEFNAHMLQYRNEKAMCAWRLYNEANESYVTSAVYGLETAFHEALLLSPHRTLDPEEADLFYLPVYTSCFLQPVFGWADHPWWPGPPVSCEEGDAPGVHLCRREANRVMQGVIMLLEAKRWVEQHLPYWRRRGGRDHIVLNTHDEGSCWVPAELRPAIVLSHWGRKDKDHRSNSAYSPWDNYTQDISHFEWWPDGYTHLIQGHACYDPAKDLVVPVLTHPARYMLHSPLAGRPAQRRSTLLYFRGDVGRARLPHYSRGIRQELHRLWRAERWLERYGMLIGGRDDPELQGNYSLALASSIFCLVAPGDGFSTRVEDAVLHGCIPVLIMDEVHAAYESVLDWPSFSVRVAEARLPQLPSILLGFSGEDIRQMQVALGRVWQRFAYSSLPIFSDYAREQQSGASRALDEGPSLPQPFQGSLVEEDAFSAILDWLGTRVAPQ